MDIERRCLWCGKTFVAHSYGARYCSQKCKNAYKRSKKKTDSDPEESPLPEIGMIGNKPFLTPKEAGILLGTSTMSVYRYIYQGVLKAVKLSENKILIRRVDIDSLFDNPTTFKKKKYGRKVQSDYYTMREIMAKFNISRKAAMGWIKKHNIPIVYEGRNSFFPKKIVDEKFEVLLGGVSEDDFYTAKQIMEKYNMTHAAVLSFVQRHNISRKTILKKVYYSKAEFDKLKEISDDARTAWYTYKKLEEEFGLTKDQISYKVNAYHLKTMKLGKTTLISKKEFDALLAAKSPEAIADTPEGETLKELEERRETARQARFQARIPGGYLSIAQIADRYKLSQSHVRRITCQLDIKERKWVANFCYFPEDIITKHFAKYEPDKNVKQWISARQMEEEYMMTRDARHSFAYRHKIPTKLVHGKIFYSKTDIDKVKSGTFEGREKYYSVEDIARIYSLTHSQIYNKVKYYKLKRVRKPPYSYFLIEDVERIFGQIDEDNADKKQ